MANWKSNKIIISLFQSELKFNMYRNCLYSKRCDNENFKFNLRIKIENLFINHLVNIYKVY